MQSKGAITCNLFSFSIFTNNVLATESKKTTIEDVEMIEIKLRQLWMNQMPGDSLPLYLVHILLGRREYPTPVSMVIGVTRTIKEFSTMTITAHFYSKVGELSYQSMETQGRTNGKELIGMWRVVATMRSCLTPICALLTRTGTLMDSFVLQVISTVAVGPLWTHFSTTMSSSEVNQTLIAA